MIRAAYMCMAVCMYENEPRCVMLRERRRERERDIMCEGSVQLDSVEENIHASQTDNACMSACVRLVCKNCAWKADRTTHSVIDGAKQRQQVGLRLVHVLEIALLRDAGNLNRISAG